MAKNYMADVARMLGVELNEEFEVEHIGVSNRQEVQKCD